jgi:hypothetical protein
MLEILVRFLKLEALNEVPHVWAGLAAAYLIMLGVSIASIKVTPCSSGLKVFWTLLIFIVPIIGMGVYASWSLFRADLSFLKELGFGRPKLYKS